MRWMVVVAVVLSGCGGSVMHEEDCSDASAEPGEDAAATPDAGAPDSGGEPDSGEEECPDGLVACGPFCVDVESDYDHCGGCWHSCDRILSCAASCIDGACRCE